MKTFIDQCKQKCEKATPGEWCWSEDLAPGHVWQRRAGGNSARRLSKEDMEFIAFARTALPEAVRRLDRALVAVRNHACWDYPVSDVGGDHPDVQACHNAKIVKELEAPLGGESHER